MRWAAREIASAIRDQETHSVLAVKGNQERLHEVLQNAFGNEAEQDFSHPDVSFLETIETNRGREERRRYDTMPVADPVRDRNRWADLAAIGMAVSDRTTAQGGEELEIRFDILSQELSAKWDCHQTTPGRLGRAIP